MSLKRYVSPKEVFLHTSIELWGLLAFKTENPSFTGCLFSHQQVIYVLMFHQNFDEGQAHVTSVAKFHLTHPLLSFIVGQVKLFKLKSQGDQNGQENSESHDHGDDDIHSSHVGLDEIAAGEEKGKKYGAQLQLFCIQTR